MLIMSPKWRSIEKSGALQGEKHGKRGSLNELRWASSGGPDKFTFFGARSFRPRSFSYIHISPSTLPHARGTPPPSHPPPLAHGSERPTNTTWGAVPFRNWSGRPADNGTRLAPHPGWVSSALDGRRAGLGPTLDGQHRESIFTTGHPPGGYRGCILEGKSIGGPGSAFCASDFSGILPWKSGGLPGRNTPDMKGA